MEDPAIIQEVYEFSKIPIGDMEQNCVYLMLHLHLLNDEAIAILDDMIAHCCLMHEFTRVISLMNKRILLEEIHKRCQLVLYMDEEGRAIRNFFDSITLEDLTYQLVLEERAKNIADSRFTPQYRFMRN